MDSLEQRQPRLMILYRDYIQQHNARVFIKDIMEYYNESTLIRLTGALCAETRRAAALALGFVGTYQANDSLGYMLKDRDRTVRLLAESGLKAVWSRDGSDEQRQALYNIMRLITDQQFGEAVSHANILLDEFPLYVEARNQRAIALFALKQFEEAIEDSRIVLELNPFHFGAALGRAHAFLQLNNKPEAIECFQQALEINPNLDSVRRHLERLTESWMI